MIPATSEDYRHINNFRFLFMTKVKITYIFIVKRTFPENHTKKQNVLHSTAFKKVVRNSSKNMFISQSI